MEEIEGKIEHDLTVDYELRIRGMINGMVTVEKNGILILNGRINGNLIIADGGECELHGTVNGNVENKGGRLSVSGTINGSLYKKSGTTIVELHAVIRDSN